MPTTLALDPSAYVDALARHGTELADAALVDLEAPIAACPGWVVRDVVTHVGRVHASVAGLVVDRAREMVPGDRSPAPEGPALVDWFRERHAALVAALSDVDPDTEVWNWSSDHRAAFYFRRMAHETITHHVDIARAVGREATLDGDLAADGVDELYGVVLPAGLGRRKDVTLPAGSLHLHRTDGAGEWLVEADGAGLRLTRAHAKGAAAVRGPGADLFLYVWHRGPSDALDVVGDRAVADEWAALAP